MMGRYIRLGVLVWHSFGQRDQHWYGFSPRTSWHFVNLSTDLDIFNLHRSFHSISISRWREQKTETDGVAARQGMSRFNGASRRHHRRLTASDIFFQKSLWRSDDLTPSARESPQKCRSPRSGKCGEALDPAVPLSTNHSAPLRKHPFMLQMTSPAAVAAVIAIIAPWIFQVLPFLAVY